MSTSFTLLSDVQEDTCIALRFWGGEFRGQVIRFAFPEVLFSHLKNTELIGSDGSASTVRDLFDKAETVEFLAQNTSPNDHLAHGTSGKQERQIVQH